MRKNVAASIDRELDFAVALAFVALKMRRRRELATESLSNKYKMLSKSVDGVWSLHEGRVGWHCVRVHYS